ncbi:MAG: hypothetical protein ABI743_10880 [bacterium]
MPQLRRLLLAGLFSLSLLPAVSHADTSAEAPSAYIFRRGDKVVYYRDKVFHEGGTTLTAPIILSVMGEDALTIMVAPTAELDPNSILLTAGHQYLLDRDGAIEQDAAFPSMTVNNTLGNEVPGVFVEGRALVELGGAFPVCTIEEDRYGIRTLTLATNKWQDNQTNQALHLYNGFRISFREDSTIESQMAFPEYVINGRLTKPAEGYPQSPFGYPGTTTMPWQPNTGSTLPPNVYQTAQGIYVDGAGNPIGRPADQPTEEMPKPEGYPRPAITTIGVIPFKYEGKMGATPDPRSNASPQFYSDMVTAAFVEQLEKVEGVEVKVLDLAPEDQSGIYVLGFARKIGQKYACDAIVHGTVLTLELAGDPNDKHVDQNMKITGEVEAMLVDTTGGKVNYENTDKVQKFVSSDSYGTSGGIAVHDLLNTIASHLITEINEKGLWAATTIG